jgi:hypothetical protein
MITEEIITVTLKKFTTTDGTVFESAGPSEIQIEQAKSLAEKHESRYDFLYFKIDENLLKEYKSENWNHFKWYFARNHCFCKKYWSNGVHYEPVNFSEDYYNNVPEEEFLYLLRKCLLLSSHDTGITFSDKFSDEKFINIIFFSGIIDFSDLKEYSDIFFNRIMNTYNIELLEKLVNAGIITITEKNITHLGDKFSYYRQHDLGREYKVKGSLTQAKKDDTRNSEYKEFSFKTNDKLEAYFKKCLSLCKSDRLTILNKILYDANWDLFLTSNYGMLCLFYQHYDNMTEEQSFKKAEEIQSALLYDAFSKEYPYRYSYLKKYAKSDTDLKIIQKLKENGKED